MVLSKTNIRADAATEQEFEVVLADKLAAADDEAVFGLVRSHKDERWAFQVLTEQAARVSYPRLRRQVFSEMFLIPVIEVRVGSVIQNAEAWLAAEGCLSELLDDWLPRDTRKTVFRSVHSLACVSAWQPSVTRRHLLPRESVGRGQVQLAVHETALPSQAPRLGFISLAVERTSGWPELPAADSLRDARFRSVLAHALNGTSALPPPAVLPPDQMPYAMTDGVDLWLSMLNEVTAILRWSVSLDDACSDAVTVTLRLQDDELPWTAFQLRRHQLGDSGIDCVVSTLKGLAEEIRPNLLH